VNFFWNTAYI